MNLIIKECDLRSILRENFGERVIALVRKHFRRVAMSHSAMLIVSDANVIDNDMIGDFFDCIYSTMPLNSYTHMNEAILNVRKLLSDRGIYIGNVETYAQFQNRIRSKNVGVIAAILVLGAFIFKRLMPRLFGLRSVYRVLKLNKHRMLSKCEALGRLVYCGFEILATEECDNRLYFVARKSSVLMNGKPCDGLFIKIEKEGLDGRPIYCYKLRTMHAYANYIHDYVLDRLVIDNNGKVVNDFRVPAWGRLVRKLWLDEMPQLFNILKGDLTFIGLRHLSKEFLELYPEEWRKERMKIRPGFVPPYYADCPKTFEGIIESERRYYRLRKKHPITTDIYYFVRVVINFLTMKARTG